MCVKKEYSAVLAVFWRGFVDLLMPSCWKWEVRFLVYMWNFSLRRINVVPYLFYITLNPLRKISHLLLPSNVPVELKFLVFFKVKIIKCMGFGNPKLCNFLLSLSF